MKGEGICRMTRKPDGYGGVKPMAVETLLEKFGAYDFDAFAEHVRNVSALKKWRSASALAAMFEQTCGAPAGTATGDVMWFGMALAYSGQFHHAASGRYRGWWRVLRAGERQS